MCIRDSTQGGRFEFTITPGSTIQVDRPELVTITEQGTLRIVTPQPGATGTVVITEIDAQGNPRNRYTLTIIEGAPQEPAQVPAGGGGTIEVIGTGGATLTVRVPGTGGQLTVGDGTGYRVTNNGDGTWTITRIDGTPITGALPLTWRGEGCLLYTSPSPRDS